MSELGRELGRLLRDSLKSTKRGSSHTSNEKNELLAKLKEYVKDELETSKKYDALAKKLIGLGLLEEAADLERISLDEYDHYLLLSNVYRRIKEELQTSK